MCQILALTNLKKIKLGDKINEIGNILLREEKDGFGYAVQGKSGVFGEKTISGKFRSRIGKTDLVTLPIIKVNYSAFGSPSELIGPGLFHGRTSTNTVNLINTHPMQIDGWNLIHNGVVGDWGPKYDKKTQNDSEDLLRRLLDGIGQENPMLEIERYLQGYYAFAAIDADGRLHIGRDDLAPLCIAWSKKLETYIFGTNESLILKTSKVLGAKIGPIEEMEDNIYMIFNGNELVFQQKFKPLGYTSKQAQHSMSSLGRSLDGKYVSGLQPPRTINASFDDITTTLDDHNMQRFADMSIGNEGLSEAEWSRFRVDDIDVDDEDTKITDFENLLSEHNERMLSVTDEEYRKWLYEIENMDASYQIFMPDDSPIDHYAFKKMDFSSQSLCTILRADGTLVEPWDYETPRLPHKKASI